MAYVAVPSSWILCRISRGPGKRCHMTLGRLIPSACKTWRPARGTEISNSLRWNDWPPFADKRRRSKQIVNDVDRRELAGNRRLPISTSTTTVVIWEVLESPDEQDASNTSAQLRSLLIHSRLGRPINVRCNLGSFFCVGQT